MTINEAPWAVVKDRRLGGWVVLHPRAHQHRARQETWRATYAEALAFVLAQPEVRRRTSKPVDPLLRSADA